MKRSPALVLLLALSLVSLLAACGSEDATTTTASSSTTVPPATTASTGTTVPGVARVGFLAWLASTPEKDEAYAQGATGSSEDVTYFDTLDALIAAVKSGQIDRGLTLQSTAAWVTARDNTLATTVNPNHTVNAIGMIVAEDEALQAGLNEAIEAVKADGALDSLIAEYVTGVAAGEMPAAVAIPAIDGADTIKVAVTGSLPPLDCLDDAGNPVGFSTAFLAELSKRLGVNVEFVKVSVAERGAAITRGQADVALWARGYDHGTGGPPVFIPDNPTGTLITTPYYSEAEYLIHLPGYVVPAETN